MSIDLGELNFNAVEPLPNGDYIALIQDCYEDVKERVCVVLSVKAPARLSGRIHTDRLSVVGGQSSDEACKIGLSRLKGLLDAIGLDPRSCKLGDLIGHQVRFKVVNRVRHETTFTNVEKYYPVPQTK